MTKFSLRKGLFALILLSLLVLGACSEKSSDQMFSIDDFSKVSSNDGEPTGGGTLIFGLVSDTPFEGTLNYNFYSGNPDVQIIDWFNESLLAIDENYNYTQDGAATFEVDRDTNSITFKINENLNWHDGEPVTAEDWAFAYEVVGHPEYEGVRYTQALSSVEGMPEYHAGEADTISGLEIIDEKTLKITYHQFTPSLLSSGIWAYPLAKHIFEDIPIADMASSDAVRRNPIGYGPYKVESIVPGESVTMVKNEDYWRGEPQLDGVTVQVINPNVVVQSLETGRVDVVSSFPADQYKDNHKMSNVEFLGMVDNAYTYIGFKLGRWEDGEVVMDPDMKMSDVNLRRAMWYAVDNDTIGNQFYDGLRWNATTLIPPSHPDYHDDSIEAPTYDPDKANEILDEAGYIDVDEDGFREDRDGNELVINFASMSGGDTAEPIAQYYMQAWEAVGLKVQLLDGRLQEFNTFYDRVEADDPEIDVYQGAWGVGSDVDPSGLYGRTAAFNYPRYASEENDRLLELGLSEEAFDTDYRKSVYSEWQELMVEEIPVFPTVYRSLIVPVNKRVVNYAIGAGTGVYRYQIGVTQDEPIQADKITPVEEEAEDAE
ncbi:oligopeptide ABC transporter substrate-binding protein [Amphibacillus xylanus]|uniref:Putative peptide ABC transporter peptide-binding protein n=1 Tax=Amphibacillus xylanus (strain ATCC 51415 / DSM 6626 / JCM 7361 / LMG 17667 / NBRC 15112 / Ep01) TaxID=698758 RepID=K0IV40_AMPXN|nr:oligopeptide ABC transporter substrate-binding protein [Amphibacillus xylanus]BAM46160.1 putative peptide ABC transporter peptide-binding protein [Amphibacillus xylanus NBRC 15112]